MNVVKQKDSMNNSEIRRKITMLRTIKKYPNRRLYDTKESRYITLKYIKKLVVENEELIIQDVKSKKDITKVILIQIIAEQEENSRSLFSSQLLAHFIRYYDDSTQLNANNYLKESIEQYISKHGHSETNVIQHTTI
ncbi:MAG: polyhydroxyalkanoate synthesis repressor PhaR [Gammaproteobacteria bacterium]